MNPAITKILDDSAARYLTEGEKKALLDFAEILPRRLQVSDMIQKMEDSVLRKTVEMVRAAYPDFFTKYHDMASERGIRDMGHVLRYSVLAMICDDDQLQEDRLLTWLARIFAGLNFTPEFNREVYTTLRDLIQQQLPEDAYAMMEPYLNTNIEVLAGIPEPYTPMV